MTHTCTSLACSSTVQPEQEHDFILVLVISPRLCARGSPTRMFRKVWNVLYAASSHPTELKPESQQSARLVSSRLITSNGSKMRNS
jgi:hypothetical protein